MEVSLHLQFFFFSCTTIALTSSLLWSTFLQICCVTSRGGANSIRRISFKRGGDMKDRGALALHSQTCAHTEISIVADCISVCVRHVGNRDGFLVQKVVRGATIVNLQSSNGAAMQSTSSLPFLLSGFCCHGILSGSSPFDDLRSSLNCVEQHPRHRRHLFPLFLL